MSYPDITANIKLYEKHIAFINKHSIFSKWSFEDLDSYERIMLEVLQSAQKDRNILNEYCRAINKLYLDINGARNERAQQISEHRKLMQQLSNQDITSKQRKREFKRLKEKLKSNT